MKWHIWVLVAAFSMAACEADDPGPPTYKGSDPKSCEIRLDTDANEVSCCDYVVSCNADYDNPRRLCRPIPPNVPCCPPRTYTLCLQGGAWEQVSWRDTSGASGGVVGD